MPDTPTPCDCGPSDRSPRVCPACSAFVGARTGTVVEVTHLDGHHCPPAAPAVAPRVQRPYYLDVGDQVVTRS